MTSHPIAVNMHMSKDEAAETMRKHKLHHLLVTDDDGKFYGLISSYDIARETALDAKAWPWPRPETHHDFIHVSGPIKSIESAERIEEAKLCEMFFFSASLEEKKEEKETKIMYVCSFLLYY